MRRFYFSVTASLTLIAIMSSLAALQATNAEARSESADAHITDVTAITRVYADGSKVSGIAVKYDKNINDASLSPSAYVVKTKVGGQKITGVYTTRDGDYFTKTAHNGQWVILELSTDYVIPVNTSPRPARGGPRPPNQAGGPGAPGRSAPGSNAGAGPGSGGNTGQGGETQKPELVLNAEVVTKVGSISWDPSAHPGSLVAGKGGGEVVSVTQVGTIASTDGLSITASSAPKENYYVRNMVVDGFMKPDWNDGKNGNLKYSIHFPQNYDEHKKYPLVVYITDSNSVRQGVHAEALTQGLGAVIWADKSQDKKDPAIVVAPLPMDPLLDANYEPAARQGPGGNISRPYLATLSLIDNLVKQFPVDKSRVYLTGQGDGARSAMKMMSDRPDLFAAGLFFAPDYDPTKIANLAKAKMWIVTSEGDDTSFPNMQASVNSLQRAGAHIAKAAWNGQETSAQFGSDVRGMIAQHGNIEYSVLKEGTVVPTGVSDDAVHNQAYTWRIGYSIEPLRDWLLSQRQ